MQVLVGSDNRGSQASAPTWGKGRNQRDPNLKNGFWGALPSFSPVHQRMHTKPFEVFHPKGLAPKTRLDTEEDGSPPTCEWRGECTRHEA
jgi:hypothetical protein